MADVETNLARANTADYWVVLEVREGKQEEQVDEAECKPSVPPALISNEQKFWTAVAEPPDISLKYIMAADQEGIVRLLKGGFDVTTRILKYRLLDIQVEDAVLFEYFEWIQNKQKAAEGAANEMEATFYAGLLDTVQEHSSVVEEELEAGVRVFQAHRRARWEAIQLAENGLSSCILSVPCT